MGSCQELPRVRAGERRRLRVAVAVSMLLVLAGCGREKAETVPQLSFEMDTAGLVQGPEILTSFEPKRYENGLLQLRGRLRFPDHTRVQIALYRLTGGPPAQMVQLTVMSGRFESPPLLGEHGPLPVATYRVEFLAHFNSNWQPADVLDATNQGHSLRGPGMTRGSMKESAFQLTRELRL